MEFLLCFTRRLFVLYKMDACIRMMAADQAVRKEETLYHGRELFDSERYPHDFHIKEFRTMNVTYSRLTRLVIKKVVVEHVIFSELRTQAMKRVSAFTGYYFLRSQPDLCYSQNYMYIRRYLL